MVTAGTIYYARAQYEIPRLMGRFWPSEPMLMTFPPKSTQSAREALDALELERIRAVLPEFSSGDARDAAPFKLGPVSALRSNGTLHAAALARFFTVTSRVVGGEDIADVASELERAAAICRLMLEHKLPAFNAAPDRDFSVFGVNDTFAAQMFVSRIWAPGLQHQISSLFNDYVRAGYIALDAPICEDHTTIGGRLPVDAAIKLGNGPAAAACVRAGCSMVGVATDSLGCEMDLVEYIRETATFKGAETTALVIEAMMERAINGLAVAAPCSEAAPRRRRALV